MSQNKAATALTALTHSNALGSDNDAFCISMWAAWRLKALCETSETTAQPQRQGQK